jgi:hypothetical protein
MYSPCAEELKLDVVESIMILKREPLDLLYTQRAVVCTCVVSASIHVPIEQPIRYFSPRPICISRWSLPKLFLSRRLGRQGEASPIRDGMAAILPVCLQIVLMCECVTNTIRLLRLLRANNRYLIDAILNILNVYRFILLLSSASQARKWSASTAVRESRLQKFPTGICVQQDLD